MKKQGIVSILIILSLCSLLVGCSNNKSNSQSIENSDAKSIEVGKYFGRPYKLTSSFAPILSLEDNNTFKFDLSIDKSIKGNYKIDNDKLVLNSNDGNENYTFEITNNTLIIEQRISDYVEKNTKFTFPELKNKEGRK